METDRHRQSKKLAGTNTHIPDHRVSSISRFEESDRVRRDRELARKQKQLDCFTPASVQFFFNDQLACYSPGSFFSCEYKVDLGDQRDLIAIEASVLWRTEGKGEEDIGVHYFERRHQSAIAADTFDSLQRLTTVLPLSPKTYQGKILKVLWLLRIRLFFEKNEDLIADQTFVLQ